jgi:hypothetical protein
MYINFRFHREKADLIPYALLPGSHSVLTPFRSTLLQRLPMQGVREFAATVVEVHSGDQLTVVVAADEAGGDGAREERRLALASVKAPRVGNPRRK